MNNGSYSDKPDFRPYMVTFPVPERTLVKGEVLIGAKGAFSYRSDKAVFLVAVNEPKSCEFVGHSVLIECLFHICRAFLRNELKFIRFGLVGCLCCQWRQQRQSFEKPIRFSTQQVNFFYEFCAKARGKTGLWIASSHIPGELKLIGSIFRL